MEIHKISKTAMELATEKLDSGDNLTHVVDKLDAHIGFTAATEPVNSDAKKWLLRSSLIEDFYPQAMA